VCAMDIIRRRQALSAIPTGIQLARLKAAKAAGLLQREQQLLQVATAAEVKISSDL